MPSIQVLDCEVLALLAHPHAEDGDADVVLLAGHEQYWLGERVVGVRVT